MAGSTMEMRSGGAGKDSAQELASSFAKVVETMRLKFLV